MSKTERHSKNGKVINRRLGEITKELFLKRLGRVCDGSVYTEDRLRSILKIGRTGVQSFVYMCGVYPGVVVNRVDSGHGKKVQYQFKRNRVNDHAERIAELAKEIIDDPTAGLNAKHSAEQIITFLGA